ncbi:hypothetical protein CNBJ3290 [Cryptococcus deneoformans B-3501A]|uniref:hypothetical protein n=1 Tax=Cryptococcus deneoformans (strain B-3501A) TaxID=283643 RepID=UPI000043023C|nr:hypothetical protein CNBJ3290 [Cryptococcus neoformans var. neoformans B-3501A]EAL18406.1 hypothetical protein CNBJ3290 [Cryptococcus neoformans var. neoformans B-3501A]
MDGQECMAYAILLTYFLLIFLSFGLVFRSLVAGIQLDKLFEGKAFFFLRSALGALLCTWYFMIQFMSWSYQDFAVYNSPSTVGQWLANTGLFEQAWSIVCNGPGNWWWSSWICTWTVAFTAIVWFESGRRGITYPYAYMLLGQLVAMSVATSLFLVALSLHPRIHPSPRTIPLYIALPLVMAFVPIYFLPQDVGTGRFMKMLLWLHGALFLVLTSPPASGEDVASRKGVSPSFLNTVFIALAGVIHIPATIRLITAIPTGQSLTSYLYTTLFSHPAQSSISLDVVWVFLILSIWSVLSGSSLSRFLKSTFFLSGLGLALVNYTGINWGLVASIVPMLLLLSVGGCALYINSLRKTNALKRATLLEKMGMPDNVLIHGTTTTPPYMSTKKTIVGFWHPYCNAGGGGERVLWVAVRYIQRQEPDTLVLVYSGDYPTASKEEIIGKVYERFSIELDPARLHFVPLKKRYLISDGYWKRFTLLGQSLGSLVLAFEGLCGEDGLWGDLFIDSMGYAFTFPLVRLIAGSQIAIGSYTHYPTVSADMVKRVKARTVGVENGGAAKSWARTKIKLLYYHIFTSVYSLSLLYCQHILTNSSWTQAHIQSLLLSARQSFLASLLLKDDLTLEKRRERGELQEGDDAGDTRCEVVYPPCDTRKLSSLPLSLPSPTPKRGRKREFVSLAQFRPEKDHKKQLEAFAILLKEHPEMREGEEGVKLVMMGGVRDEGDQQRLEGLKKLATELNIEDNVEFVVSAPYSEIVRRLGQASVGLNTMMDEHFGINVVEFMAAGLIPVVHASAGPLLDIVVPFHNQRTGFHATTAASFAEAMYQAMTMSDKEAMKMRKAARQAAEEKFSEKRFEEGWEKGWRRLTGLIGGVGVGDGDGEGKKTAGNRKSRGSKGTREKS